MPKPRSTAKTNKFNTHIQCLSGTHDQEDAEKCKQTWRPSNDMDIVKRNANDIKAATTYIRDPNSRAGDIGYDAMTTSTRSSRRSSKTVADSNAQASDGGPIASIRQRPDSALAVLQGNALAQKQKKVSMITLRREQEQLASDINAIRGLI